MFVAVYSLCVFVVCKMEISAKDIMATLPETVDAYTAKSVTKSTKKPCMSISSVL